MKKILFALLFISIAIVGVSFVSAADVDAVSSVEPELQADTPSFESQPIVSSDRPSLNGPSIVSGDRPWFESQSTVSSDRPEFDGTIIVQWDDSIVPIITPLAGGMGGGEYTPYYATLGGALGGGGDQSFY